MDGVPILIKDNLMVRDLPVTWGCRLYQSRAMAHDEISVEKLRQAGAIIVGKTYVPEFTIEGYTDNELFDVLAQPDPRDHRSLKFAPADSLCQLFDAPQRLKILAVETDRDRSTLARAMA